MKLSDDTKNWLLISSFLLITYGYNFGKFPLRLVGLGVRWFVIFTSGNSNSFSDQDDTEKKL